MRICVVLVFLATCFGDLSFNASQPSNRRVMISAVGGVNAISGSEGKSIAVCEHGDVIAVIYGDPTTDPNNPMEIKIAYSNDGGATFITYGAFSPELRWIYPCIDGTPTFCTDMGNLWFCWQERPYGSNVSDLKVMLEENVPSAPSFSTPISLPNAVALYPSQPCIASAPNDPSYLVVTAWSSPGFGDKKIYCWISADYGYSWSDPAPVVQDSLCSACHFRIGTSGYIALTCVDNFNYNGHDLEWPFLIESTDGGLTWLAPIALPVPWVDTLNGTLWLDFDLEVINNQPWIVHADVNADSTWLFYPSGGGPGNWTWNVVNVRQLGWDSLWFYDTLYICRPDRYPSISYNPTTHTALVSYKAFYYWGDSVVSVINGAHIGGIATYIDGAHWYNNFPLSTLNNGEITWEDWSSTEVAHRFTGNFMEYPEHCGDSYGIWINTQELNLYFERGSVFIDVPGIHEQTADGCDRMLLMIEPSICDKEARIFYQIQKTGSVTIRLYDMAGRMVEELFRQYRVPGSYSFLMHTDNYPCGIYILVLENQSARHVQRIVILHK